eukprot:1159739-Pelagomonas_calceolata.AAC.4
MSERFRIKSPGIRGDDICEALVEVLKLVRTISLRGSSGLVFSFVKPTTVGGPVMKPGLLRRFGQGLSLQSAIYISVVAVSDALDHLNSICR